MPLNVSIILRDMDEPIELVRHEHDAQMHKHNVLMENNDIGKLGILDVGDRDRDGNGDGVSGSRLLAYILTIIGMQI